MNADMGAIEAVLCDVDGVLRRWAPMAELDAAHGLPGGSLAGAAFASARLLPAITGAVTDEEWRSAIAGDLEGVCGSAERARRLVADWGALPGAVDESVLDLLRVLRRQVPVVLVSNGTTRLEADLDRLGLTDQVDAVVNSARIGAAKPDPLVYRIAAERAGRPVERCLFIDDTVENVLAAQSVGMTGIHFRSAQQLRVELALAGPR